AVDGCGKHAKACRRNEHPECGHSHAQGAEKRRGTEGPRNITYAERHNTDARMECRILQSCLQINRIEQEEAGHCVEQKSCAESAGKAGRGKKAGVYERGPAEGGQSNFYPPK